MKFQVGDLIERTKPFPEEVGQLWIVVSIEEEDEIRPITFISIMSCKNQYISKFTYHVVRNGFKKVD